MVAAMLVTMSPPAQGRAVNQRTAARPTATPASPPSKAAPAPWPPAAPRHPAQRPSGVAAATPAHSVMSAGATASLVAGQDINIQSQRHTALAVKAGLSLFTYGKAQNPKSPTPRPACASTLPAAASACKPNPAPPASPPNKNIQLASTTNAITAGAPKHIQARRRQRPQDQQRQHHAHHFGAGELWGPG